MMNTVEMRIEELENNGYVVVTLMMANGGQIDIEMYNEENYDGVVGATVVTVEAYEENGYDVEGLETEEIKF